MRLNFLYHNSYITIVISYKCFSCLQETIKNMINCYSQEVYGLTISNGKHL